MVLKSWAKSFLRRWLHFLFLTTFLFEIKTFEIPSCKKWNLTDWIRLWWISSKCIDRFCLDLLLYNFFEQKWKKPTWRLTWRLGVVSYVWRQHRAEDWGLSIYFKRSSSIVEIFLNWSRGEFNPQFFSCFFKTAPSQNFIWKPLSHRIKALSSWWFLRFSS